VATTQGESHVARGYEALAAGDWETGRSAFERALDEQSDDAEALAGEHGGAMSDQKRHSSGATTRKY
jgi:hypothetical protein